MTKFLNGIIDNYVWFLLVSILLIFALIGFFVDLKRRKNSPYKLEKEEINLNNLEVNDGVGLSEMLSKNKTIGVEETPVNMDTAETIDNNANNTQV